MKQLIFDFAIYGHGITKSLSFHENEYIIGGKVVSGEIHRKIGLPFSANNSCKLHFSF
jgi:hypothetical protein